MRCAAAKRDRPLRAARLRAAVIVLVVLHGAISCAAAGDAAGVPDLRHDMLPLLRARCVKCHGPMKHEAGLNLATPRSIARGGESGSPVAAGNLDDSLLWTQIDENVMPPMRRSRIRSAP